MYQFHGSLVVQQALIGSFVIGTSTKDNTRQITATKSKFLFFIVITIGCSIKRITFVSPFEFH